MKSVCASAPGKVILFGEHAVVYGVPAIAAALSDLRISVLITPVTNTDTIRMIMADLPNPIDCCVPLKSVLNLQPALQAPPTKNCASRLESLIRQEASPSLCNVSDEDDMTIHAIVPLLYLINQLLSNSSNFNGLEIQVKSQDLPLGAGWGSSAAFGVASAAALIQLKQQQASIITKKEIPSKETIEEINQFAYYSEILLHGRPSGIDNAVSAHGGAILFDKSDPDNVKMKFVDMQKTNDPLELLLVYTHVPRSTKKLVAGVREMYNQHPTVVEPMLKSMGNIAQAFCDYLLLKNNKSNNNNTNENSNSQKDQEADPSPILTWVRTNQYLLRAVGVSHPSLDCICDIVDKVAYKEAAAKLTGAGGGGCGIVLFQPDQKSTLGVIKQKIKTALQRNNQGWKFSFYSSTLGGSGVLFVPPEEFAKEDSKNTRSTLCTQPKPLQVAASVAVAAVATFALLSLKRK